MAFISKSFREASDPVNNLAITRFIRDVPRGERWFYFTIKGVQFRVKTKFSVLEEEMEFRYICEVAELEKSFSTALIYENPKYSPDPVEFRQVVLPQLRDAIIYLESKIISTRNKDAGWHTDVIFLREAIKNKLKCGRKYFGGKKSPANQGGEMPTPLCTDLTSATAERPSPERRRRARSGAAD